MKRKGLTNVNISFRTIIGFLVMAVLLAALSIGTLYHINHIHEVAEKIIAENFTSVIAAKELELALTEQRGLTTNFLLTSDEQWLQQFDTAKTTFYNWLRKARESAYTLEVHRDLEKIRYDYEKFLDIQRQVVALNKSNHLLEAYTLCFNRLLPALDTAMAQCEVFWDTNERLVKQANEKVARSNAIVTNIIYGVLFFGTLLGVSLGIIISRSITNPIYELVKKVRSVTEKPELVENVEIADDNELELLGRGVWRLIDKFYQVNRELDRSQKVLIRSERLAAAGQLAAGIAHEIRNPLTTVKMLVFALKEEQILDNGRGEDLQMIIGEVERMETILQSFLDFARPPEPEFNAISLAQVIETALALTHPEMRRRAVHPHVNILPCTVWADRNQITQMLINLFRNAMDSMPNGGDLRITTRRVGSRLKGTRRMVQIEISDTGTGIPDQLLPRLFDPFVTGKSGGTGLGLSIAHQIVETHKGWIEAKNNGEGGATFTVALPIEA